MHEMAAEALLRSLQSRVQKSTGVPVEVGKLATAADTLKEHAPAELTGEDREPVELAARVIAHAMHRVPGARRVAKMMEGREAKSGVGSDLFALAFQLAERNEAALKVLAASIVAGITARKEEDGTQVGATGAPVAPVPPMYPDATGAFDPNNFPGSEVNGPGASAAPVVPIHNQEVQQ